MRKDRKGNAYITFALSRTTINTINSGIFKHLSSDSYLFIKVHIGLFENFVFNQTSLTCDSTCLACTTTFTMTDVMGIDAQIASDLRKAAKECSDRGLSVAGKW